MVLAGLMKTRFHFPKKNAKHFLQVQSFVFIRETCLQQAG
jgi:hypothetical protein